MIAQKKASIIYVLKILEEYSDENHPLTQQQIIDLIKQKYDLEIERKSVANSLTLLEEIGYDIYRGDRSGVYLITRLFDPSEVTFLIDAIYSSKVITASQAKELSKTLFSTLSKHDRKQYNYTYKSSEINRNINQDFFYNIDLLNEAINKNKKISFQYITHNSKGEEILRYNEYIYRVSPYFLINNFGKYYLLCHYYKWSDRAIFRIDHMRNIKILDDERENINNIEAYGPNFNISKYINDHIYIFGGKTINATVRFKNDWAVSNVIDWFGSNAFIYSKDGKLYANIKCDDKAIFYWVLQYSTEVEIIYPHELRNKMIATLKDVLEVYEENPIDYQIEDLKLKDQIFDYNSYLYKKLKDVMLIEDIYLQGLVDHITKITRDSYQFIYKDDEKCGKKLIIKNENSSYLVQIKIFKDNDYYNEIYSTIKDIQSFNSEMHYTKKYLICIATNDFYFIEDGKELFNELINKNKDLFTNLTIVSNKVKNNSKIEWFNIPRLTKRAKYFIIES